MKQIVRSALLGLAVVAATTGITFADEPPAFDAAKMPKPTAEHAWLQKYVGTWHNDVTAYMPGQPADKAMKTSGTEEVTSVGGFWVLSENHGDMMGSPYTGVMNLGYDPEEKHYVGTWVDSMTSDMWKYEGTVDKDGKVLTLKARGACPMMDKETNFKDVTEWVTPDHKRMTSYMEDEKGNWVKLMEIDSTRQK